uniref:Uncharacterized protein n=1 Tax=Oryza sativa subsp. japonica TaxID=39947 RepID=Q6YS80_ORYSJ|nr:hypothetical protein [Oryza sativa Japonica Group]
MARLGGREETPGGLNRRPEARKGAGAHQYAMGVGFQRLPAARKVRSSVSSSLRNRRRRRRTARRSETAARGGQRRQTRQWPRVRGGGVVTVAIWGSKTDNRMEHGTAMPMVVSVRLRCG